MMNICFDNIKIIFRWGLRLALFFHDFFFAKSQASQDDSKKFFRAPSECVFCGDIVADICTNKGYTGDIYTQIMANSGEIQTQIMADDGR